VEAKAENVAQVFDLRSISVASALLFAFKFRGENLSENLGETNQ